MTRRDLGELLLLGALWGWLFLAERPSAGMLAGCAVILLGTALATGALRWPSAQA